MGKNIIWFDDYFHEWKFIPLYMLNKTFGLSFKFHSNLSFNKCSLKKLLPFYRRMLISWNQDLSRSPETSTQILSQLLWFNKYIKLQGTIHFPKFSNKNIKFIMQLFENCRIIKIDMNIQMTCFFSGLNWNMQFLWNGKN